MSWANLISLNPSVVKNYKACPKTGTIQIGRGGNCDIVLESPNVSAHHCTIEKDYDKIILEDSSTNGTFVNDKKIKDDFCVLNHGDVIRFGKNNKSISFIFKLDVSLCSSDYKVKKLLGSGGYSNVFLACRSIDNKNYAIKIIKKNDNRLDCKRRESEVQILKMINHPNINRMVDYKENDDDLTLVLEYCEGGDLFQKLYDDHYLNEDVAKGYFAQIFRGVEYLHSKGIAHRDLKPENILFKDKERTMIQIADFGFSSLEDNIRSRCGTHKYVGNE